MKRSEIRELPLFSLYSSALHTATSNNQYYIGKPWVLAEGKLPLLYHLDSRKCLKSSPVQFPGNSLIKLFTSSTVLYPLSPPPKFKGPNICLPRGSGAVTRKCCDKRGEATGIYPRQPSTVFVLSAGLYFWGFSSLV
ncbi:hypothetical protein CbuG_1846 [Coxiella burnetii CbuG_Q212]|nr:hypothetical protein CbuG_1846 [Coxiella burnetii CbuG_Q212]